MRSVISGIDKIFTTFLQLWFYLGGTVIAFLLSLFFLSYSSSDFLIWLVSHFVMVTGLSVGYHRYFAHKTFKANRFVQFLIGLWGSLCLQRGPLWWTSWHRMHHRYCGTPDDPHTPSKGVFKSHCSWFLLEEYKNTHWKYVQDLAKYPELCMLEYGYFVTAPLISILFYLYGGFTALIAYQLAITTSINTISCVNSVCHDHNEKHCEPRNIGWIALFGAGEGFHANHHNHPGSAYFGSKWYHFDLSYLLIRLMGALRIVKAIKVHKDSPPTEKENPLHLAHLDME